LIRKNPHILDPTEVKSVAFGRKMSMCGRFTLASQISDLRDLINFAPETMPGELPWRFNIAPTQPVLAFRADVNSLNPVPALFQWGLVPFWAKDITIGPKLINARSETVNESLRFEQHSNIGVALYPSMVFMSGERLPTLAKKSPGGSTGLTGSHLLWLDYGNRGIKMAQALWKPVPF